MAGEPILIDATSGVLTVTLNRPEKLNALTPCMHAALDKAFDRFAVDDALHICVVKGAGERAFCAGSDLAGFKADGGAAYPKGGYAGIAQRRDLAKPVIAQVQGVCLGGGFELALACDMIVAADGALFGLPEPKVGLIAIGGGIHRLVRQAGIKRAMGPLLTGRNIPAHEGLAMGFVSEVVAADTLDRTVADICRQILANAPLAVRLTKELAMWGLDQPHLAEALSEQGHLPSYRRWSHSQDAREGPIAFTEKRPPNWTGR
jgi:enoyl-CoA hydratase/carnithine racemase